MAKIKKIKRVPLSESEMRYRRLFETAHDGILILDSETGQITDVNPYLEKLLGYTKNEFLNKKLWEVGAFRNMKASRDAFRTIQKEGYIRYEDLPLETKSGELVEVEFVSNSYIAGGTLVIQCNIRDITERKRVDSLKDARRLLEEERLKVRSIAYATHELRTPLAIIKGNVDLVLHSKSKKTARSALHAIDYEINHLSGILTDLSLITSKSWELKSRLSYEEIHLKPFVNTVIRRCRIFSSKKKISIIARNISNLVVIGDKIHLEKMLMNLIRNSIIYGHRGGCTYVDVKKSKQNAVLSITDNGVGISEEDLPHVFERFYRVEKLNKSGEHGVGLGLAIVKWVAETHGGEVHAKSIKGKGSVFSVTLPIKVKK